MCKNSDSADVFFMEQNEFEKSQKGVSPLFRQAYSKKRAYLQEIRPFLVVWFIQQEKGVSPLNRDFSISSFKGVYFI